MTNFKIKIMTTINKFVLSAMLIALLMLNLEAFSQVGIGTTIPDVSSMLEVKSTTKGLLAPRMTSVEKAAISSPANGLLVYDTTLGKFCYYNGSSWITLEANTGRDNYVLVKTLADFPAPSGGVITLVAGTMYEINGTISMGTNKIDINGCEITGGDSNNDKLNFTGTGALFTSTKGGIIKNLTLYGNGTNNLFSLNDSSQLLNLVVRDCNIAAFASVGSITGYNLVLMNLLGYVSNANGITYNGVMHLFVKDQSWFPSNAGTVITLTGNFDVVGFIGGLFEIDLGETGLNLSGIGAIDDNAFISSVSFVGAGTRTVGTFAKQWEIDTPGINTEKDDVATGAFHITTSAATIIGSTSSIYRVNGTTESGYLFRVDEGGQSNRLRYVGTKTRQFKIIGRASVQSPSNGQSISIYIAKNNTVIAESRSRLRLPNANQDEDASIVGSVELAPNDYIEIGVQNNTGTANITFSFMNIVLF